MSCRRARTPIEQLQPFEQSRIVGLREVGWTYRRIAAHVGHNLSLHSEEVFGAFQHMYYQVLDGRVVQTHVKIDALCEQWWELEQHPGKKSGHM